MCLLVFFLNKTFSWTDTFMKDCDVFCHIMTPVLFVFFLYCVFILLRYGGNVGFPHQLLFSTAFKCYVVGNMLYIVMKASVISI